MILFLFLFLFIVFIFRLIFIEKLRIKLKTFFRKGLLLDKNQFGIYCYVGKQGQGKTTAVVSYLYNDCKGMDIYSNIHLNGIKYKEIHGFKDLLKLKDKTDIVIFFDEIFTALSKKCNNKVDWSELMAFLSQMRKRRIIFLTTAQEWLEIDLTFRRYCRFQINCNSFNLPFFKFGILKKVVCDVDNMVYDKDLMEYVAPPIATIIEKYNKRIVELFDTYEVVNTYNS